MKVAILYGSSLGNTQTASQLIQSHFPGSFLSSVSDVKVSSLPDYDLIFLGSSTWGLGDMQDDFDLFMAHLLKLDLAGLTFALFGLGDQRVYPDSYCNGMGKLYQHLKKKNVRFVGSWPTDGYDFSESEAVQDGHFVGLALDEENDPDLSPGRVSQWVERVKAEI